MILDSLRFEYRRAKILGFLDTYNHGRDVWFCAPGMLDSLCRLGFTLPDCPRALWLTIYDRPAKHRSEVTVVENFTDGVWEIRSVDAVTEYFERPKLDKRIAKLATCGRLFLAVEYEE